MDAAGDLGVEVAVFFDLGCYGVFWSAAFSIALSEFPISVEIDGIFHGASIKQEKRKSGLVVTKTSTILT